MADRPKISRAALLLFVLSLGLIAHGLFSRFQSVDFDTAVVELVDGDADKLERKMLLRIVADQGVGLAAERKEARLAVLAFVARLLLAGPQAESAQLLAALGETWARESVFVPGGTGTESAVMVEGFCLGEDRIRHLLLGYRAANLGDVAEARQRFGWAEKSARLWGHGACERLAEAGIGRLPNR